MNNNQISNPKVDVPTGKTLNDKDYLNCLLSSLKEMTKNYAIALTETSNETLYNEYLNMFKEYSKMQREVFELMFRKGWYALEKAPLDKIINKFQTLNQEYTELNTN